jgi:hypothetical protein
MDCTESLRNAVQHAERVEWGLLMSVPLVVMGITDDLRSSM